MYLDLRLPLPLLRSQIEAALNSVADAVRAGIQVRPQGEILLSGYEGRLVSLVPVRITANSEILGLGKGLLGGLKPATLLSFDLEIEFRTRLSLGADWELAAQSEIAYQWTKEPVTGLGLIQLPLKELVKPILERELRKIGKQVDTWVPELTGLPARIAEAWTELQRPLPLDEPMMMRLRPRKEPIPVSLIRVEGQSLRVEVQLPLGGIVGLPEDVLHIPMVPLSHPIPLEGQTESKLILTIHLPWTQLQQDLSGLDIEDHSTGRPIHLSWGQMNVSGQGQAFTLDTRFRIKGLPWLQKRIVSGHAQLSWRWRLDPDSERVSVDQLAVVLREAPPWLQTLWPVLRPLLRKLMTKAVVNAVNAQILQTRQEVEAMIQDYVLPTGGRLQGRIRGVEILAIDSHDLGLQAQVRLSGEAKVILTDI
jgi:hypothetical protein